MVMADILKGKCLADIAMANTTVKVNDAPPLIKQQCTYLCQQN